jgi:hypothetical protein
MLASHEVSKIISIAMNPLARDVMQGHYSKLTKSAAINGGVSEDQKQWMAVCDAWLNWTEDLARSVPAAIGHLMGGGDLKDFSWPAEPERPNEHDPRIFANPE